MKRELPILGMSLGLYLCLATPSWSETTAAQKEATQKLPHAMSDLLESTFYCQAVTGEKLYTEAKALALSVLGKLTDLGTAERFVAGREKAFEQGCPLAERATCWADYLDLLDEDPQVGREECNIEQELAMAQIVLTLQTMRGVPTQK